MKKVLAMLLPAVVIVLSACGEEENNSSLVKGAMEGNDQLVLLENKEADIKISGVKQPSRGMFGPLIVHIGETSRSFNWENEVNETFYPELSIIDLDNNQKEELIIILTLGHGTGIKATSVHVINKDFTEIPFPNPLDNAQSKVESSVTKEGGEIGYTIKVGEKTNTFTFKEEDAGEWFEHAVVGKHLDYRVEDNAIIAEISVQVSPGMVIGSLEIPYKLVDGQFIEQPVQFIAFE